MEKIITIILLVGILSADEFNPRQNDTLNYTHILFQWPQVSSNIEYTLTITNTDNDDQWSVQTEINSFILEEFLNWGNTYQWQVCYESIYGDDCFEPHNFSLNDLPDNYPDQIELKLIDESKYFSGINMIAIIEIFTTIAVDQYGDPVWFFDIKDFDDNNFYMYEILPNGNLVGHSEQSPSGYGYEVNLDSEIIFKTNSNGHHHEFIKSTKNTYFGIKNDWVYELNHCEDPLNEYVYWQGSKYIEYDEEGNNIWEWSTLDYLNHTDFNPIFCNGINPNSFDWTHSNSVLYDQNTNSVMVSLRNISRIVNIDYETGEINWQIGQEEYMSDSLNVNIDFDFSGQHSLRLLENGHILFFDNHAYLTPRNSKCVEFSVNSDFNNFSLEWEYTLPDNLYSHNRGECERVENGNTLISTGYEGQLLEVTPDKELVWNLEIKHEGELLTIMRNERLPGLYPLAFNTHFNNYNNGTIKAVNNEIEIYLTNLGWIPDMFHVELYSENDLITIDSFYVEKNSSYSAKFEIPGEIDENKLYTVNVFPTKAPDNIQQYNINFKKLEIPRNEIALFSFFPNPFNKTINFQFAIPDNHFLEIAVYNLKGQKIDVLFNGYQDPGFYTHTWEATNYASGVYFIYFLSDEFSFSKKVVLIK